MNDAGLDPIASLLRRWWVVLAVAVGTAVLVVVALILRGPVYSSNAIVRVVLTPGSSVSGASQVGSTGNEEAARVLATQQNVVLGDQVIGRVADELKATPDEIRSLVSVTPGKGSDTLRLTGSADSPEAAEKLAAALARAYVEVDKAAGRQQFTDSARAMQAQLDALKAQRDAITGTDPAAQAERATIQTQYNSLLVQQQSLVAQAAVYPGNAFVLNEASLELVPSSLSLKMGAVLGFGLGVILGCALVLLAELRRMRLPRQGGSAESRPPADAVLPDPEPASVAREGAGQEDELQDGSAQSPDEGPDEGPEEAAKPSSTKWSIIMAPYAVNKDR